MPFAVNIGSASYQTIGFLENYASDAYANAEGYLNDLNNYVAATISTTPPTINIDPPGSIIVDPSIGAPPEAPTDSEYPVIPTQPTTQDFSFPTAPSYTLPTVPVLSDIVLPDFIENTIAGVTTSMPVIDFSAPAVTAIQDGGMASEDALIEAAKTKLTTNITNGGTMLNPAVEADIWNRDRARREQALQDAMDKLTSQWAKLGWTMPDGLLAGSLLAINNEYMNKDSDASLAIAIKQAELEQAGMFKSIELATTLETLLFANINDYAKRVFETSKTTADVTIELYKQRVVQYNTMLEAVKADVMAYKTRVEAELGRAEVYKARLSGIEILTKIDESKVKQYVAQIGAAESMVKLYETQVQAVATQYSAEKEKIAGYKARVDAYTAVVDGITKKYLGEVEGYKSYVQAWSASADSQTKFGELKMKGEVAEIEATLKAWEVQSKLVQESTTTKLEALKTVATVSSNLAAGALSAIHASVSDQTSNTQSWQSYQDLSPNA